MPDARDRGRPAKRTSPPRRNKESGLEKAKRKLPFPARLACFWPLAVVPGLSVSLALDQAKDKEDPFVKGVQLAYDGFLKALKDHGAEPFDSVGETLDPNRHEAIATLPSETVEEGKISTEVKEGWMLNGRLLRAAQVVVSSGKSAG